MKLINHISLSPSITKKDHYQSILASQSYGTFYLVYAEFTTKEDEKNYYIENIKLKIINYKGLVNLGIKDATFIPVMDKFDKTSQGLLLNVSLKAFEKDTLELLDCDATHPIPKVGSKLMVNRTVLPMHDNGSPLENGIFDEEFYYRDGVDPKGEKGLSFQKREVSTNVSNEECIEMFTSEGFSRKCPISGLIII